MAGCGAQAAASGFSGGKLTVVTAFYPLQFLSERIGGDAVTVTNLTKPGAEPHDVELNPRQVGQVADAGLAVYLSGFQPAVDAAVEQEAEGRSFDVGHGGRPAAVDAGGRGPVPTRTSGSIRSASPPSPTTSPNASGRPIPRTPPATRHGPQALHADLDELQAAYANGLATCQRRELVTSHAAFNYLATRYGLTQVGITGISPEAEPSPRRLAEVAAQARGHRHHDDLLRDAGQPQGGRHHRPRGGRPHRRAGPARGPHRAQCRLLLRHAGQPVRPRHRSGVFMTVWSAYAIWPSATTAGRSCTTSRSR